MKVEIKVIIMNTEEKIQILKDIVALRTVNQDELKVATYFKAFFAKHGIASQMIQVADGRTDLLAEIGTGKKPILAFSGHADTVHEGDITTWSVDPFQVTEKNGRLYGRGTSDMKGSLAAFAIAMVEIKESGVLFPGTLRFILSVDEEMTEAGSQLLTEKGYIADVDAMVIGEPTAVPVGDLDAYFHSDGAVISSDTLAKLKTAVEENNHTAPEQHFIVFAHKGFLAYEVTATGKAAHSSMPKMGINAVDHLVQYYLREKELYETLPEESPIMGRTMRGANVFYGGKQQNSVPDQAVLTELTRIIPELSPKELITRLENLVAQMNEGNPQMALSFNAKAYEKAVVSDPDNLLVTLTQDLAHHYFHEAMDAPTISVSLGTDASQFIKANPKMHLVILGAGDTTAHQADEYVEREAYLQIIDLYRDLAVTYLRQIQ